MTGVGRERSGDYRAQSKYRLVLLILSCSHPFTGYTTRWGKPKPQQTTTLTELRIEECAKLITSNRVAHGVTVRVLAKEVGRYTEACSEDFCESLAACCGRAGCGSARVFVNHALERVVVDGPKESRPERPGKCCERRQGSCGTRWCLSASAHQTSWKATERMTEEEREAELKRLVAMVKRF